MKTYDVLGYISEETDVFCPACADEQKDWPIFADTEWDVPLFCDGCDALIPVALTDNGVYELEHLVMYCDNPSLREELLEQYGHLLEDEQKGGQ